MITNEAKINEYYVDLFVKNPTTSTPHPGPDESARWAKIEVFLKRIAHETATTKTGRVLRILDVGCGRGWLTNLVSAYGEAEGVEPVAGVVNHARKCFPRLRFFVGTPKTVLKSPDFKPYDVIVSSEVIEHVSHREQSAFVASLMRLLQPGGYVILTTPRAEAFEQFRQFYTPDQPIEDWLSEQQIASLFSEHGFHALGNDRIYLATPDLSYVLQPTQYDHRTRHLIGIYQVWAFQSGEKQSLSLALPSRVLSGEKADPLSNVLESEQGPVRTLPQASRCVLIACTHFPPSVGGLETVAAQLGKSLIAQGYEVHAATERSAKRVFTEYCGMTIHSLDPVLIPSQRLPQAALQLRDLIVSGRYDACILLADPRNWIFWSLEGLEVPEHTRIIAQPLINAEGFARWRDNHDFRNRLTQILKRVHSVVTISTCGTIAQYLTEEGIPFVYIPNAIEREEAFDGFRARYSIPESVPVFLHIANLWPVKNHLGLMDALSTLDGDWRLVMIGHSSGDSQYDRQVHEAVRRDLRFVLIPGLPRHEIAAALNAADILLLASHGEVAPVTVLEAMSHAKPWLATPQCGGVHDNAGGLILPIEEFPSILSWLVKNPYVLQRLGRLGYEHWSECFRWDVVISAWDGLIKTGASSTTFVMPPRVTEEMQSIRAEIPQSVRRGVISTAPASASNPPLVSVIVPTFNRPDTLLDALQSILNQSYENFEIIVVNDGGSDIENIVRFLNKEGRITYIRHGKNRDRAAARNTGIRVARGKYIAYLDDDDLYSSDHLQTLVTCLEQGECKVAYTDAYRAHQEKRDGRYVVSGRDIPYSFDFDHDRILVHNFIPVLCLMHERECLDVVGLFDESLTTHEDWELWIRMSRRFQFAHIKKVTCEFVSRTDGSTTTSSKLPDFRRTYAIILERYKASAAEKPHIRAAQERLLQRMQEQSVGTDVVTQPARSAEVVEQVRQVEQHLAHGDLPAAAQALSQALQLVPHDSELIVAHGNVLLRLGDVEAARREFVKATTLNPKCAPAFSNLAVVLLHLGRLGEAETAARRALTLNAGDTDALKVLARVCLDSERYTEAVQVYVTILGTNPDDLETLLIVGNCYAEAGRPEDAKTFYQRVLQLDPGNAVAVENLAAISGNGDASDGAGLGAERPSEDPRSLSRTRSISHEPIASIVIVTYNSARTIRACLESVFSSTQSPIELIVVDNASTDATRTVLAEYQGRITTLLNTENAGFSRGCNQGIHASVGEYVVLLNPDTVVTPRWLEQLISHLGPGVGAVGPVSDYAAGLQNLKRNLPDGVPKSMGLGEVSDLLTRVNCGKGVETKLLIGFCLMLPRRVLNEVGLLDEELFLGNDDLDLSWRLRLKGHKLLVAADTFVHHEGQVSFKSERSAKASRLVQESTDRLYAKIETYYGPGNVPSPMELWGITWFKPTETRETQDLNPEAPLTPHPSPFTSIIVLTHNGLEHTKECLTSIETHTPEPYELIIVDNASTDGTLDYLRDYMVAHDNIRVVANRTNRGFAAGNNQGLALAGGAYVLLLNNDTIVTEGWLRRMLAVFKAHPGVGIVGPMSNRVSGPQLVRDASYKGPEALEAFAVEWTRRHDGQSSEAARIVGFCLLARKEVVARIGGLDEQFGSGNFEDDDFCIRAFQVGFRSRIALDVFIHHTGSQTFKVAKIDYRQSLMRNWELFKHKWGIPADAPYEKGYRFPPQSASDSPQPIPLPDVNADHQCDGDGRWWPESPGDPVQPFDKDRDPSRPAVTEDARLNIIVIPNGHGLAPLWPSLVKHTNHPLAITISPSNRNGNSADLAHEGVCPKGWQVKTGKLPSIRVLNQLIQSADDNPVILLSGNLIMTPGWLKRLLAALKCDQGLAAVGPTSNRGVALQQIKSDYKGIGKALRQFALRRAHRYKQQLAVTGNLAGSCIVFNPAVCRSIGPLREDTDLTVSLTDYFARIKQAGHAVAVALDAYVHCE